MFRTCFPRVDLSTQCRFSRLSYVRNARWSATARMTSAGCAAAARSSIFLECWGYRSEKSCPARDPKACGTHAESGPGLPKIAPGAPSTFVSLIQKDLPEGEAVLGSRDWSCRARPSFRLECKVAHKRALFVILHLGVQPRAGREEQSYQGRRRCSAYRERTVSSVHGVV